MRTTAALASLCLLVLVVPARGQALDWHLTAMVAESCSCAIACRCNFGGEPDGGKCEGNRIISIEQGHYNGVDLAGVQILVTFHMRTWSKIYISDTVSDAQMKAVDALMPLAFAGFQKGMLSFTRAPITMEVSDTRVRFSGPESTVDMEVMNGFNGQAVKILNLPAAVFQDYTQFRSVSHTHTSATHRWTHSGTNGFTSKWDVGSRR
ncbi:MAG: DUF1326 domain-containing protein [Acidobacteria bacterium]|nr:DUF1326 domain-containing protein [Acidobacteriota bacterium]